jgi:hypothetical protein
MATRVQQTAVLGMQIVCKPTACVMDAFAEALLCALQLGLLIVVEPKAFSLVVMQLQRIVAAALPVGPSAPASVENHWDPYNSTQACDRLDNEHSRVDSGLEGDSQVLSGGFPTGCSPQPLEAGSLCDSPFLASGGAEQQQGSNVDASSRCWGGSATVLTQAEIAEHLAGGDAPTQLITERGRLGAKLHASQEASEMADALFVALQSRSTQLCRLLDADVAAAEVGMQSPEEWIAQVWPSCAISCPWLLASLGRCRCPKRTQP